MFIVEGIISGIIATLLFDIFQYSLSFAYDTSKPKWHLVGRYIAGLRSHKYFQQYIDQEPKIQNELIIGFLFHYSIGSIFGLIYVILNLSIYNEPSIFLSLVIGFATVLGSWCIIMPYCYNLGFFASKINNREKILVQNLIAHFIFGVGLFIGYVIMK